MSTESTGLMETMMPAADNHALDDLVFDLVQKSSALASQLHPVVQRSVGDLVRSMNCYYSNLIEGHDTHPWDIERALAKDYASEPEKRHLQLEAVAHIEVQQMIDVDSAPDVYPATVEYVVWLHKEFCERLPEAMRWVEEPETGERVQVVPGKLRDRPVRVGRHIPPLPGNLPRFMQRFEQAYAPGKHSKSRRIIAAAASHHRLLWIHPFFDGNGRVTRLMSHAILMRESVGSSLWSVARGLARNVQAYKELLMAADNPRRNDLDGRGTLSESALVDFCTFFLTVCIDQVEYMGSILRLDELTRRMRLYVEDDTEAGRLPKGSYNLLREALLSGEVERGRAPELTGYKERMARHVVSQLLKKGLLVSESHKAPLRLGFPLEAVERWFPRLYPATGL
jgi:Fic family protein